MSHTSDILKRNGSAADAMIAAMLCEGIACPQSTGIGGGFVMTIYTRDTQRVEALVARDQAPLAATEEMYVNQTSVTGARAIAVPGELKGYWELHQRYGKLPWAELVQPSIDLCRRGHTVSRFLAAKLVQFSDDVQSSPSLAEVFVDPVTNNVYRRGQKVKRLKLADTLEVIARDGVDAVYGNGTIGQLLVKDIQAAGGIVTIEDLMEYRVRWEVVTTTKLSGGLQMFSVPAPTSGPLLTFMMNILDGFVGDGKEFSSYQRIIEVFKYAYARRTDLADPHFVDIRMV